MSDLPDFPAIKKLAEALWRQDAKRHGAAIMVGAGFSRCAALPVDNGRKLPLWWDFAQKLAIDLSGARKDLSFSDPLRLAEEYRAYFGQAALNDLIKSQIQDESWQPGELHSQLLGLPWVEVLTTNWDTLLERAALQINSPIYGLVSKQSDLSCVRSPRIVKLHGSIGVTENFIFAQEDYRCYPSNFAAFVNFARQVLIENELCLLGFSGDDPNFLQWAGWVRDHLTNHARRIYLVGALNLSPASKKYLESINIAIVDLWDSVKEIDSPDLRHYRATQLFLDALAEQKPKPQHKWTPVSASSMNLTDKDYTRAYRDHEYAASLLKEQISELSRNRETYPGWLICPPKPRYWIDNRINQPHLSPGNIAALGQDDRERLLYEVAWQHLVSFSAVDNWMIGEFEKILEPIGPKAISTRQQLEIVLLLVRVSRQSNDLEKFERWIAILEKHAMHLPDCMAEINYQRALMAREVFDYEELTICAEKVVGEDSVWKLRQASLFVDLGRLEESEKLVSLAFKELLARSRHEPNSVRVYSRLAWAHWLARIADDETKFEPMDELSLIYQKMHCDPWDEFSHIRELIGKRHREFLKQQVGVEPLFEKGHYRQSASGVERGDASSPLLSLEYLVEVVGIPLRWKHTNIFSDLVEQLAASGEVGGQLKHYSLAVRAAHRETAPVVEYVFSRIALANTKQREVHELNCCLRRAVEFWIDKRQNGTNQQKRHAVDVLNVLIESLSRVSIRLNPSDAKEILRFALGLGRNSVFDHFMLHETLGRLIKYSLNSIPEHQRPELLVDLLMFPLPHEKGIMERREAGKWPNPVIDFDCSRENSRQVSARISELLSSVIPGTASCAPALLRLMPLLRHNYLTEEEIKKLALNVWGETENFDSLPDIGLLLNAFLVLPVANREALNALLPKKLYDVNDEVFFESDHLESLIGVATNTSYRLSFDPAQAIKWFDKVVAWRHLGKKDDPLGLMAPKRRYLVKNLANALSFAIVPFVDRSDLTAERFDLLRQFVKELDAYSASVAYSYFSSIGDKMKSVIENELRNGLHGQSVQEIAWAAHALYKWKEISVAGIAPPPPESLFSNLVYLIRSGHSIGLSSLIKCAASLAQMSWLPVADMNALASSVSSIFHASDYGAVLLDSKAAISAPVVREGVVKLAAALINVVDSSDLNKVIALAKTDALPEVRLAV